MEYSETLSAKCFSVFLNNRGDQRRETACPLIFNYWSLREWSYDLIVLQQATLTSSINSSNSKCIQASKTHKKL